MVLLQGATKLRRQHIRINELMEGCQVLANEVYTIPQLLLHEGLHNGPEEGHVCRLIHNKDTPAQMNMTVTKQ